MQISPLTLVMKQMIQWFKVLWLRLRLRFAKRVVGIDVGLGPDSSAWCEARFLKGKMYIVNSGVGEPPAEVYRGGRVYSNKFFLGGYR